MSESNVVLVFNGHRHQLTGVLGVGKNGPPIAVDINDINDFKNFAEATEINEEHIVTLEGAEDDGQEVFFYKQHGKYTVLLGRKKVIAAGKEAADNLAKRTAALEELDGSTDNKTILREEYNKIMAQYPDPAKPIMIKGKLISSPALKSVRILAPGTFEPARIVQPPPPSPPGFENRPQWKGARYPGTSHARQNTGIK